MSPVTVEHTLVLVSHPRSGDGPAHSRTLLVQQRANGRVDLIDPDTERVILSPDSAATLIAWLTSAHSESN